MKFRSILLSLLLAIAPIEASAQSNYGLTTGQVPTATQWNGYFSGKVDFPATAGTTLEMGNGGGGFQSVTLGAGLTLSGTTLVANGTGLPLSGGTMTGTLTFDDGGSWGSTGPFTSLPGSFGGVTLTAVAPTVGSGQIGYGSTTTAATSCGSLSGAAGCVVINVAGTAHYVPYW
jgi:hypothetical protein